MWLLKTSIFAIYNMFCYSKKCKKESYFYGALKILVDDKWIDSRLHGCVLHHLISMVKNEELIKC